MTTLKMTEDWTHFNPCEHMNKEFIKFNMPHMDVWTCRLDGEEFFDSDIKLIIFSNSNNAGEYGEKTKVIVQITEQYNGMWQDFSLEELQRLRNDFYPEWAEMVKVVEQKLRELNILKPIPTIDPSKLPAQLRHLVPVPPGCMRFELNFDKVESANDERTATTYYGGYITINGKDFEVSGNDRGEGLQSNLIQMIEHILGRKLTNDEYEQVDSYDYNENGVLDLKLSK